MATTQKKTGGRSTSGGKRPSSAAKGKSASSARNKGEAPAPAGKPFRRELGAVLCLLLGIFAAFGYFHIQALFIDFYIGVLKGALGYGFWLVPPALALGAYILAFHRGRPVRLRLACALLLPLILSCLLHGLLAQSLPWNAELFKTLWESGQAMQSGGALGGVLAQALVTLVSELGCTIVAVLAGVFMGLAAFNRTIFDVADWVFNRPHPAYEPQPEPERRPPGEAPPR